MYAELHIVIINKVSTHTQKFYLMKSWYTRLSRVFDSILFTKIDFKINLNLIASNNGSANNS